MDAFVFATVNDGRATAEKIVDGAGDRFLISRNRGGGNEHDIALANTNPGMLSGGDAREGGSGFALAAGQHNHAALFRESEHFIERDQHPFRWGEVAELDGDAGVLLHAATGNRHLAVVFL